MCDAVRESRLNPVSSDLAGQVERSKDLTANTRRRRNSEGIGTKAHVQAQLNLRDVVS
jgi:hypothetical protein